VSGAGTFDHFTTFRFIRERKPKGLNPEILDTNIIMISNALEVVEYNEWVSEKFIPYVGARTLEVGAGIGTLVKGAVRLRRGVFSNVLFLLRSFFVT